MKRLLPKTILFALATSLSIVSAAAASPVIDPVQPQPVLIQVKSRPLTDGWYTAALQQTLINAKKHHPVFRSSVPTGEHGPVLP